LRVEQIPRPDGREDNIGVDVLREPSGQTNVAELELLMQVSMTAQNKLRSKSEVVRSIERAAQRPREIDQWIASVEKVQKAKPLAEVKYKQAMPPLARLLELWPEEFEDFLATRSSAIPALADLDVSLKELAKIVCALVDIPVYEGNCVQSLHVLFSLYLEIEAYERDAQRLPGLQR
jgi:intraflagellar transport protein 46